MDIVPQMFKRPLDAHQLSFALGEALAQLHVLWARGILQRQSDADGTIRFMVFGESAEQFKLYAQEIVHFKS